MTQKNKAICPQCGEELEDTWRMVAVDDEVEWDSDGTYFCPKCQKEVFLTEVIWTN